MKVGLRVTCTHCGCTKRPIGRSAPIGIYYCDSHCPGYYQSPKVGDLWPGETEDDFGFPVRIDGTTEASK